MNYTLTILNIYHVYKGKLLFHCGSHIYLISSYIGVKRILDIFHLSTFSIWDKFERTMIYGSYKGSLLK